MLVNREQFLRQLTSVQPGLSPREIIEQSSCFVFSEGEVGTFNDELCCRSPSLLENEVVGAVDAKPLMELLAKLPDEEVEITAGTGELLIKDKRGRNGVRMEVQIVLPLGSVDRPEAWSPLPEEFTTAIKMVSQCAGKDASDFASICVHFHPKWLEASDDTQIIRYRTKVGVSDSVCLRGESARSIHLLEPVEFAETPNWLHFRSHSGTILSARRHVEDYPSDDITAVLKSEKGAPMNLPKGLVEACEKASAFVKEDGKVLIDLRPGRLRFEGRGVTGWRQETLGPKKIQYDGPPLRFLIPPKLLAELVKTHNDCHVSEGKLRVDGGRFTYLMSLGMVEENGTEEETEVE